MTKSNPADPLALFRDWLAEAEEREPNDPTAMCLATADASGRPSARMVLLKAVDARGLVFYSNLESRKGRELTENPHAALCFHWKSLRRQVRIEGLVAPVADAEADAYFASRDRGAQIGAWASEQSRPLPGRFSLERRVAEFTGRFGLGAVARPPYWHGLRLAPDYWEFWRDRPFRLHERQSFIRDHETWRVEYLYP